MNDIKKKKGNMSMITFNDIKYVEQPVMSFVPMDIAIAMKQYLRKEHIKTPKLIKPREVPSEFNEARTQTAKAYAANGLNIAPKALAGCVSNIDPQYLFEKLKLFYGPTIDADHKAKCDSIEKEALEHYQRMSQ